MQTQIRCCKMYCLIRILIVCLLNSLLKVEIEKYHQYPKIGNGVVQRPGPEVIKLFLCSAQLSTKFILLINVKMPTIVGILNVKMPTIVGILTFISMINTTSERLKENFFICRYFSLGGNSVLS